jgi:glycosyltransferase involved in cell wall biosynthesis
LSILHVLEKNRLVTGSVVQMMEAARQLALRGHRLGVASRPGGDLEAACAEHGIEFVVLDLASSFDLGSARRLRRHLRSRRTDLIHVHKGRAHSVALLAAIGLGARPAIVVNRGVSFPLDRLNRAKYRHPRVAAVVCVAEAVRRLVIAGTGLPPERVHTVHAGTDPQRFDPQRVDGESVRRELALDQGLMVVGQVSVREGKGWRTLLEAFALIRQRHARVRLLLVGCEPERELEKVRAAASELGLGDELVGLPYRSDMPELLAACDLVVDASHRGTGITGTIREAMALARPVVASDCGGNRELVIDSEVGLVVPPGDPESLAAAVGRLLGDPELRTRLGQAARKRVLEGFTTEQRVDRLETLYEEIVRA